MLFFKIIRHTTIVRTDIFLGKHRSCLATDASKSYGDDIMDQQSPEPYMKFSVCVRRNNFPQRTAYTRLQHGLFPFLQIKRTILVRESEVLAALAQFRHESTPPHPYFKLRSGPKRLLKRAARPKSNATSPADETGTTSNKKSTTPNKYFSSLKP
jgi:hypothetical protein